MKARGTAGQLRVGGRMAATLGAWSHEGTAAEWQVEAETLDIDEYLFESGGPFHLRLYVGEQIWQWRGVTVSGRERVTITGEGRPNE